MVVSVNLLNAHIIVCTMSLCIQVACFYGSKDSRRLFRASAGNSLAYSPLDNHSEPLASDLHELSKQLESLSYITQFNQDQVL